MRPKTSQETLQKLLNKEEVKIVSFLPIDSKDCDCFKVIKDWVERLSNIRPEDVARVQKDMGMINCPSMVGKKHYEIRCGVCGDLVAYVHATDESLKDWCNLHYVSEAKLIKTYYFVDVVGKKGKLKKEKRESYYGEWHGCMTPNVSPIDGKFGFECACGNDSRDFRLAHLTTDIVKAKIKENMIGREFNQENSKYILVEVK